MLQDVIEALPVGLIDTSPQVRQHFDEREIIGLAMNIRAIGQLVPIRVRRAGGRFIIVDGERRFRAAKKAGLLTIAAIVEGKEFDEGELLHRQISINVQRADLSPLEKATSVVRLMKVTGWNATETSRNIGVSNGSITKLTSLLSLPDPIKAQLAEGKIALSTAYELAKVEDATQQSQLANEAAAGRLTRDAAVAASRRRPRTPKPRQKRETFRVKANLPDGGAISISGPKVSLASFVQCLAELLSRARDAERQGLELAQLLEHFHSPEGKAATCTPFEGQSAQSHAASVASL